jgi:integrase
VAADGIGILKQMEIKHARPAKGQRAIFLADGGNLYLYATVGKNGTINRSWIFRYQDGFKEGLTEAGNRRRRRHDMGLGPLHTLGLADARQRAQELRQQIKAGIDPLEARQQAKRERHARLAEEVKTVTFQQCAEMYIAEHSVRWTSAKHAAQWTSTLTAHVFPTIGKLNVADIELSHIRKLLALIWNEIPVTASRVQKRIENILDYAKASEFRTGENPARWTGHLKQLIVSAPKQVEHLAAMPYVDVPVLMGELKGLNSIPAQALEFTILCAVRTGETIGATWDEVDLKKRVWVVPAARMKMKKEHKVPLCDRAVAILEAMPEPHRGYLFPAKGKPLADRSMLNLLTGMRTDLTVHGFRSSFRDWAAERTTFPEAVVEMALAHAVGEAVVKAYKRTDLFDRRVKLMKQWGDFLAKPLPVSIDTVDLEAERHRRSSAR